MGRVAAGRGKACSYDSGTWSRTLTVTATSGSTFECPAVRIRARFGTDEFISAYNAAVSDHVTAPWQARRAKPGSFGHLCQLYYASATFKLLDAATQSWRRRALGTICNEHADKPVSLMLPRHVRQIRDALKSTPG